MPRGKLYHEDDMYDEDDDYWEEEEEEWEQEVEQKASPMHFDSLSLLPS